jgi:hypothetical protein
MVTKIGQNTSTSSLVVVQTSSLRYSSSKNTSVGGPDPIIRSIHLVNGPRVPDEHITGHSPELRDLMPIILEAILVNIDKDSLFIDDVVIVRSLEVDGRPVLRGCFIHGDPEPNSFIPGDGTVLVVLMPLEALVGVDHEQIRGDANFICAAALGEDVSHGRMVVKVRKCLVGLPYVSLDVIVELGRRSREGPEVGFFDLGLGGFSEVVHPLGVEDSLDVDDSVSFEGLDLFLGDGVCFGGCDPRLDAVGKRDFGVLESEVVLPEVGFGEDLLALRRCH